MMLERSSISSQFAANLREAQAAARAIAANVSSIDALVAQTREAITDSRRTIEQVDRLLAR